MIDTSASLVQDMYILTTYMHSVMHIMQQQAITLGQFLVEGFPGRLLLEGNMLVPVLDPISGDSVPR